MLDQNELDFLEKMENVLYDLPREHSKYTVKPEEMPKMLEECGLTENYNRWDKYLKEVGFKATISDISNRINKVLVYKYEIDLSVRGDHWYDAFTVYAFLKSDCVYFVYENGNISNNLYRTLGSDENIAKTISRYIHEKQRYFIFRGPPMDIEVVSAGGLIYFVTKETDNVFVSMDVYTRLAVILDFEMHKRYPFTDPFDYERIEEKMLERTLTEEPFFHEGFEKYSDECIMKTIIGCSVKGSRADAIDRAKKIRSTLPESASILRSYLDEGIEKLSLESDEEFEKEKVDIFNM